MAKSKSKKKLIVFLILGVLLVAGLVTAKLRKQDPPIPISEEKVVRRNITEVVPGNGKVEPVIQVKICPEVSGEIIVMAVKEGQHVNKGDLLFKIKPDNYLAARDQFDAGYKSAMANRDTSAANLEKADLEYKRNDALYKVKLISESDFLTAKTSYDVAKSTLDGAVEQVSIAKAQLDNAEADLSKTTVYSPLTGTVSKLNCEQGERVVGTGQMAGTEVMTVADLNTMEARIDIGEIDVPLIKVSQKATMEVDSFKDQKFDGIVTEVADSANNNDTSATSTASTSTDATKFQVKIRISQKDAFLPGMSVTADVQTRYRSNVLTVPIQSVTTRVPPTNNAATNLPAIAAETNAGTNLYVTGLGTNGGGANSTNQNNKPDEPPKPIEVVFVVQGDHVKMVPVKRGISDDNYVEILEGPHEGDQVVSGGYKAINRDLEDGKKVILNTQIAGQDKEPKTY
ncbi:MAG TPA: efflux RND transporter periplasmic adaptor subunit [Candidatus Baltobacteraceae bacterium]|jgi:HlyD family secretion protein|nr:efflux RND transporter periplasmic adaptor subunit [Candidatus Baltobacteraceae bacterium]